MVVEFLTFTIDIEERHAWMPIDEQTWSRFLEQQPGFVSKQLWAPRENPNIVHAVIVWESELSWQAIPVAALAAVDIEMGPWHRQPQVQVFDLIRDC